METLTLSDAVRETLREGSRLLVSPYEDLEPFILDALKITTAALPRDVLLALRRFRVDPQAPGALLLRNLPIDDTLPQTPVNGKRSQDKHTYVSEAGLIGTAALLGEPIGFRDEREGEIIQILAPIEREARATSSESSEINLAFHTDFSFNPDEPDQPLTEGKSDYIALLCLRGPREGGATLYADAREVCRRLVPEHEALLRQPLFQFAVSYSFTKKGSDRPWSVASPVLTGPAAFPEISADLLCGWRALNDDARRALEAVRDICALPDVGERVTLAPGDLLIMDNRKGLHARGAFSAAFDGQDRWLHRVYVRRSVWELRGQLRRGLRVF